MNSKDLLRVRQFCADRPAFTESSIRWFIHNAQSNGLANAKAVVRLGGNVYIHSQRFDKWIEQHAA